MMESTVTVINAKQYSQLDTLDNNQRIMDAKYEPHLLI